MERWRLITSWNATPELAMGLDEALLVGRSDTPTLRLYSWEPDTLSLGYFQRFDDVPGTSQCGAVVRRITGGGAIHHTRELTFSISLNDSHPLYRGPVAESYERVHRALFPALQRAGVEPSLCGTARRLSDREATGMCFHASTPQDIVWNDRKGLGSAQRRRDGRILHHGSLKLGDSPLEVGVATLPETITLTDCAELVRTALVSAWDLEFCEQAATVEELRRAQELGARYCSPEFVRRR